MIQLQPYDNSEICADGFLIYLSTHQTIERIARKDPQLALELYLALARYNFYGEEYTGDDLLVESVFNSEKEHFDRQRDRYAKAKNGGRKNETIPFETILATIATGKYTTLAAVGEALGTSGQNIGRRLKTQNLDFKQLVKQALSRLPEENETAAPMVSFPETNPTNTYTNISNENFETVSKHPSPQVSNEQKNHTYSDEFIAAQQQVKDGKLTISSMLVDLD